MAITIYDGKNFQGKRNILKTGEYPTLNGDVTIRPTFPNSSSAPSIGIDRIDSVKVAAGTYAECFITQGFRDGSFLLFEGEYKDLGSRKNHVDAIKVFDHDKDLFPIIEFYQHSNYGGFQQNLAGTGQLTNFDFPFMVDNIISSVKVPEGVTVTLFRDGKQKGSSLTLKPGNYPHLGIFNFNDITTSVQIVQNNLEVTNIQYVNINSSKGEPILIESIAQNDSSLEQQASLNLETAYEESFTRSFSNSTLFGLEISNTATAEVGLGPVSASVSQTISVNFENTFTFGREETKSKTISISKALNVNIPPGNIAKATMILTPQTTTIKAIYTLKLIGSERTTEQEVLIEIKNAAVGSCLIEKFTPVEV